jgi:hypothetical protein
MRLGLFRLNRPRTVRAVAGLVAAFLFTGNVLAAAGLCAMKAPDARPASHATAQDAATPAAHACDGHVADELQPGAPSSSHHCPTDDPSAQSRTVDVPAAQPMPALVAIGFILASEIGQAPPLAASDHPAEQRPLYARLQRLRL